MAALKFSGEKMANNEGGLHLKIRNYPLYGRMKFSREMCSRQSPSAQRLHHVASNYATA